MACILRIATPEDAHLLTRLGLDTFNESFAHMYKFDDVETYRQATYGEAIQAQELADPDNVHFIAEIGGKPAGYAKFGLCKLPIDRPVQPAYELHRLYVLSAFQGSGAGHALMQAVLKQAKEKKAAGMYLGVWEGNLRAQAFYRRAGFVKVGEYKFQVGTHYDDEWIMQKQAA